MTKKLIRAIKASIRHWERDIVKPLEKGDTIIIGFLYRTWKKTGENVKSGMQDCSLCAIYYNRSCIGCPLGSCSEGSIYKKFVYSPRLKTARAMVRKLKSLLPKEEK